MNRRAIPFDPAAVRRVLVVKPDHLGDMVLAVPALDRLRRLVPGARIDVLGRPEIHAFTVAHGLADRVLPLDAPWLDRMVPRAREWPGLIALVMRLRRERYDLAVNLRHDVRDIALTALVRARWSASYDHRGAARRITHCPGAPDPLGHESTRWNGLLDAIGAPPGGGFRPRITEAARDAARRVAASLPPDRPRVALHVASRRASKNWPVASWRELVAEITGPLGAAAVLVGGPGDRAIHADLTGEFVADAAGAIALADLPALFAECRAFVGADSGPAHLAALVGLPTVVLFSGTELAVRWAPLGERVTVLERDVPCRPCRRRECDVPGHPCLTAIRAGDVAAAVRGAIG
jgi:ADP-heptose:LPS heptosyltransferase